MLLKVSLSENLPRCVVLKLHEKLRNIGAVINVDCEHARFKYAVLNMLHYYDVKKDCQCVAQYMRSSLRVTIHGVTEKALATCRRKVVRFPNQLVMLWEA